MIEKVPIGEIIKQKLKENDRSMAWLAQKVNCDSSNFCKKLNSNNIDVDLLFCISEILQEDFFAYYSGKLQDIIIFQSKRCEVKSTTKSGKTNHEKW